MMTITININHHKNLPLFWDWWWEWQKSHKLWWIFQIDANPPATAFSWLFNVSQFIKFHQFSFSFYPFLPLKSNNFHYHWSTFTIDWPALFSLSIYITGQNLSDYPFFQKKSPSTLRLSPFYPICASKF